MTAASRAALSESASSRCARASPAGEPRAAAGGIDEAKAAGAAYVLTPEMTNIMETKRDALMAAIDHG